MQRYAFTAAVCAVSLAAAGVADAQYQFTRLVDTATTAPGSSSAFVDFDDVAFDGEHVAFIGEDAVGESGVYRWNNGTLSLVANEFTGVPLGGAVRPAFTGFANLALDNGAVAFQGSAVGLEGVYTDLGGTLRTVADTDTQMPGSSVFFTDLFVTGTPSFDVSISGDQIAFSGFGSVNGFNEGVYRERSGVLERVADRSTTPPDETSPFVFFRGEIDTSGDDVVFYGRGAEAGVWTTAGAAPGQIRKVFDENSALPGLTPPTAIFAPNTFQLDGGDFAFMSTDDVTLDTSLFIDSNGDVRTVVSEGDINPATETSFRVLRGAYSLSEGRVLFSGWSNGPGSPPSSVDSILLSSDSGFDLIIADGEVLNGQPVTALRSYGQSLAGESFVFEASFPDGSTALYLAEPEPTGPTTTVEIAAAFDAQGRPGNAFPLGELDAETLAIDGGSGGTFPRLDLLMEFPLGEVPAGAELESARLVLEPTNSSQTLGIRAMAYGGDGVPALTDPPVLDPAALGPGVVFDEIGLTEGPFTAGEPIAIDLDTDLLASLLEDGFTHLGLSLESTLVGPFITIAASESGDETAPTLFVEYATGDPIAGDFNGDGVVNAADYTVWRDDTSGDFAGVPYSVWADNYGAVTTQPGVSVPEPAAVGLVACVFVGIAPWRRSPRRA